MKTILINKTLTTIALLSTIQCGWGTETEVTVSSWSALLTPNYTTQTQNSSIYTLNKANKYILKLNDSFSNLNSTKLKLIISENVEVINTYYIIPTNRKSLSIENNGTFNNQSDIAVTAQSTLKFSTSENNTVNIGKITNTGKIYTIGEFSSIEFSVGDANDKQIVTTLAAKDENEAPVRDKDENIIWGEIGLYNSGKSTTISPETTLSFGKYGKFYAKESGASVTLNGTIGITSRYASIDVSKMNISSSDSEATGTIDMSKIQECSNNVNLQRPLNLCEDSENNIPATFICGQWQQLPEIILPFYCKFNSIDLSYAAKVYYTILKKGNTAKIEGGIIMLGDQVTDEDVTETYGDYATQSLGVTLPEESKRTVTTQYAKLMSLSYVANNENTYNEPEKDYKLNTTDLTDATDSIATDATRTYNFGFIGTTPIKISGNGKAIFKGNNSGYEVAPTISVSEVEFGNKSLFSFTQTYIKGTFTAGGFTNTIPAGAEVKFTGGFTLGKGHTLNSVWHIDWLIVTSLKALDNSGAFDFTFIRLW